MTADERAGLVRARAIELATSLPEVETEVEAALHVGFLVRGRRFAWFLDDHHGDGRLALHCKAAPGHNRALAAADPSRHFIPPYLGAKGWTGLWLDVGEVEWDLVEGLLVEAYRLVAPKRLVAALR